MRMVFVNQLIDAIDSRCFSAIAINESYMKHLSEAAKFDCNIRYFLWTRCHLVDNISSTSTAHLK